MKPRKSCILRRTRKQTTHKAATSAVSFCVGVASSSRARILGESSTVHSLACAFFFFFFEVEISSRTPIPLFGQDQSTVAQRAEMTVTECSLMCVPHSAFPHIPHSPHTKIHCTHNQPTDACTHTHTLAHTINQLMISWSVGLLTTEAGDFTMYVKQAVRKVVGTLTGDICHWSCCADGKR